MKKDRKLKLVWFGLCASIILGPQISSAKNQFAEDISQSRDPASPDKPPPPPPPPPPSK